MLSDNLNASTALINRNNRFVKPSTKSNSPQFFNRVSIAYDNGGETDLLSTLPYELLLEVAKNLSLKDYKNLSGVNKFFNKTLIGELKKNGTERIYSNIINLLFKGKVVSKLSEERQLVILYLLTVGVDAVNRCRIYELDDIYSKDFKESTGIEYFLEYPRIHFKSWLDNYQIIIEGYDEEIQEPFKVAYLKPEKLINLVKKLAINIDKYQLDLEILDKPSLYIGYIGLAEFIKLKTSDKVNQHIEGISKLNFCRDRIIGFLDTFLSSLIISVLVNALIHDWLKGDE
ncbi:MAG: F-box protein [Burkholderiales bacterium]